MSQSSSYPFFVCLSLIPLVRACAETVHVPKIACGFLVALADLFGTHHRASLHMLKLVDPKSKLCHHLRFLGTQQRTTVDVSFAHKFPNSRRDITRPWQTRHATTAKADQGPDDYCIGAHCGCARVCCHIDACLSKNFIHSRLARHFSGCV